MSYKKNRRVEARPCPKAAEQSFGFLFRRYEAEYHWWELMFFFRKLALISTQAFFSRPLDQCLLTMLAIVPGMLGVVRAKPYDSAALDVMEWVACASSFVILFAGFLFFSDLLTPGRAAQVDPGFTAPRGFPRLKLKCDKKPLSSFGFNINMRPYTRGTATLCCGSPSHW